MKYHILVVDDDEDTRVSTKDVLEMESFKVILASSGPEAITAALHRRDIGLILMDLSMPGMTGWDVAMFIRTLSIPIVIASALHGVDVRRFPSNVVGMITKPFEIVELLGVVEQYMLK